jgi:hypothetical protein
MTRCRRIPGEVERRIRVETGGKLLGEDPTMDPGGDLGEAEQRIPGDADGGGRSKLPMDEEAEQAVRPKPATAVAPDGDRRGQGTLALYTML